MPWSGQIVSIKRLVRRTGRPKSSPLAITAAGGGDAPQIHGHTAEHDHIEGLRGRVPKFEGLFSLVDLLRSGAGAVDRPVQGPQFRLQAVTAHQAQREY